MDREENYPLGIIIGDVNGLKLINDAFGHESDLLLKRHLPQFPIPVLTIVWSPG